MTLTAHRIQTVLALIAGGLIGWVMHPTLWLVAGPVRWSVWLAAMGWAESYWTASATNPERAGSVGVLQFQPDAVNGFDAGRTSAFQSGIAAGSYVASALWARPAWFVVLRAPVLGYLALRVLWRAGRRGDVARAWDLSGDSQAERQARFAAVVVLALWAVILCAVLARAMGVPRARRSAA